jgi:hypothetical protein
MLILPEFLISGLKLFQKNYVVTIELILAGDENLTPNQNIEIFSVVYSFIRSTLYGVLFRYQKNRHKT